MATKSTSPSPAATSDREIVVSRVFDAPRELVWQALTDRERVGKWWGPYGFTTTTFEMDVRPGGVWRFIMHGPDGTDYPNRVVYREVREPERLVYGHGDGEGEHFEVTVTLREVRGKTELTLRHLYRTAEERDRSVEEVGAIEGGRQTLERLSEYLATV